MNLSKIRSLSCLSSSVLPSLIYPMTPSTPESQLLKNHGPRILLLLLLLLELPLGPVTFVAVAVAVIVNYCYYHSQYLLR